MKITVEEGSGYLRGLLLLIRKDSEITEQKTKLMKRIGKVLGFEEKFCDSTINEVLENRYILDEPPEFSTKELAEKFIKDGLTLATSGKEIHALEEVWLKSSAENNGLDVEWFLREKEIANNTRKNLDIHLEVDDLDVEYSPHTFVGL
ncbi:MAG: hypothetical protein WCQ90_06455 [Deltaproteobacteria bacterium]